MGKVRKAWPFLWVAFVSEGRTQGLTWLQARCRPTMFLLQHPHSPAGPAPRCSLSASQSCTRTSAATSSESTTPSSFFPRGLTNGDTWRLDIFEGDEYERKEVTIRALRTRVVPAMLRTGMYKVTRSPRRCTSGLLGSIG